jgi:biofilm PGA synthesis N-glycosyltransferase PgaC
VISPEPSENQRSLAGAQPRAAALPRERYIVVSPVRNEAQFARRTLDSMVAQTVPPAQWIIVDDGSTDATPEILADYARRYDFIKVVTRADRGARWVGGGVVETFNEGLAAADVEYDYLCKLDMDLDLPPRYFERLLEEMRADPRLGTVSGKAYFPGPSNPEGRFGGELISERIGDDVSLGMTKFYRREFFEDIGGLVKGLIWDGLDCYKGRMLGWRARSIDDPELRFIHLRPMGSSDRGVLTGRQRLGKGYWFIGASPLFLLASALYRLRHPPAVIGSLATLWGYGKAAAAREPRYGDPEFRRYLRRYHRTMLVRGRAAAVRRFEDEGAPRWRQSRGAGDA